MERARKNDPEVSKELLQIIAKYLNLSNAEKILFIQDWDEEQADDDYLGVSLGDRYDDASRLYLYALECPVMVNLTVEQRVWVLLLERLNKLTPIEVGVIEHFASLLNMADELSAIKVTNLYHELNAEAAGCTLIELMYTIDFLLGVVNGETACVQAKDSVLPRLSKSKDSRRLGRVRELIKFINTLTRGYTIDGGAIGEYPAFLLDK